MDYHGRRNRRGRGRSRCHFQNHSFQPQDEKPWSFLNGLYNFFIMSTLIAIIYLMLEHHCNSCSAKCDLNNITKNIDDIAKNLSSMTDRYCDLEKKISKFSQELPKIEGQIEILEALANSMDNNNFIWDTKPDLSEPNLGMTLNRPEKPANIPKVKNCSMKCPRYSPKPILVDED